MRHRETVGASASTASGYSWALRHLPLAGTRFGAALGIVGTIASILLVIGGYWDGWWHFNLGRDTFWTRPHLLMYADVVINLVLGAIGFGDLRLRPAAVMVGLGGLLSIAAAPIDNLWHAIFGLDFTIWSLPHLLGIVYGGAISMIGMLAWWMTQARFARAGSGRVTPRVILAAQVGAVLPWLLFVLMEYEQSLVNRFHILVYRWDLQAVYYPVFVAYLSFTIGVAVVRTIGPTALVLGAGLAYALLLFISRALGGMVPMAAPVPLFIPLIVLAGVAHRTSGLIGDLAACVAAVPLLYVSLVLVGRPVPHDAPALIGTTMAACAGALAGRLLGRGLRTVSGA